MRRAALFLSCLCHLPGHAATLPPSCGVASRTFDSMEVLCLVAPEAQPRHLAFIARFAGGHDDTRVSIQTSLAGQPLACDDGSKLESFAEDGDLSLQCRFAVTGGAAGDARLQVVIRWSHAQFTDYELMDR